MRGLYVMIWLRRMSLDITLTAVSPLTGWKDNPVLRLTVVHQSHQIHK